jgi:phosphoglycolate phosphatase
MQDACLTAVTPRAGTLRHVIFDLDGTLVDSCAVCVDILSEILAERGATAAIDRVGARAYMSRGGQDMVAALLGAACRDPAADLLDFRSRYQQRHTSSETLFPGVAAGLAQLRAAGLTLSICSNKPQELCEKVLADLGLAGHFAVVVGGRPGLRPKPAPDLLEAVLNALDTTPDACLFVGDSELDHAVAIAARMPFHFMTYGYAEAGWVFEGGEAFGCFDTMTRAILSPLPVAIVHA